MFKRLEPMNRRPMTNRSLPTVLCALALAICGCIVEAPTASSQQKPSAQQQLPVIGSNAAPLQVKVGANLADKVEIVGAIVDPGQVVPGQPARVSVFFRALDTIKEDWMVFVHVEDVDGRMERLNVDHKPANGTYPTNQWKKGETVRDDFQIYVPPGSNPRGLNVLLGLWDPASDARMKLKNTDQVRNDGKDRVLILQVPVAQQ